MNTIACLIVLTLFPVSVQNEPKAILDKAIKAAGGVNALKRARVLSWDGKATVYAGGREIKIEGTWLIEPPDRATVTTWEAAKGKTSSRTIEVDGQTGTTQRDGKRMPMPKEMLENEREQFFLYSILQLAPLLDADVKLSPTSDRGNQGLLVTRPGRPEVRIFFDNGGRPTHLLTTVGDPISKARVDEELRFEGSVRSAGVRWPKRIQIFQRGKLFFDLEISNFRVKP